MGINYVSVLVQEQVYAWVIASSVVMLLEDLQVWQTKLCNVLETELVYRYDTSKEEINFC